VDADKVEGIREIEVAPEATTQEPEILEDICVEELAIDGICGVY
jgi:mycofactocin precursor